MLWAAPGFALIEIFESKTKYIKAIFQSNAAMLYKKR